VSACCDADADRARGPAVKAPANGGGWHAIGYTLTQARKAGFLKLWSAMRAKNACKTCALGMGGQLGGMVNEQRRFPEFCKKSIQAMTADMQPAIPKHLIEAATWEHLSGLSSRQLETMGRLITPLVAEPGAPAYRAVSWDEAFERLSGTLKATPPDESFFYFSGRSSNEAGFLLQLFARMYGTNNVNNCSFYCHQASGVGLTSVIGASTGTVSLEDLEHADCLFLIGGNPASNHPRFMRTLMDLKRRGGTVIVVNPLREVGLVNFKVPSDPRSLLFGTRIADLYVQPHIGGDIPFLAGIAKEILERDAVDHGYLAEHTTGWEAYERLLTDLDWATIERSSGVDRATIVRVADAYVASRASVFAWAMGITHHRHGVANVRTIANLALMRGMVGRPGAGLLPLRGHSNIQGLGTVGVSPKLKEELFRNLQERFGVALPTGAGMDTMTSMQRAAAGGIRVAWCLGGNLYGSNPDAAFATSSMREIDQVVYLNTSLNTGHIHGRGKETWVLPVLARDEEPEPTTQESMFSFVRLSDGGRARHRGPMGEVQLISALARRVLPEAGPIDWSAMESHGRIREVIAAVVPGMAAIADLDQTKQEFQIPGRAVDSPSFKTADGRARMHPVRPPEVADLGHEALRMMTVRSEGQFNTVIYEDHDRYRGQERRDVLMMARADRERMGLAVDQRVTVSSSAGQIASVLVREVDIRPGNAAMYYPEANVLVPRDVDPESGTPSFKNVLIQVRATDLPSAGAAAGAAEHRRQESAARP
jgi:molybdopterin-dependent oxidoreductase alpha subunit